MTKELTPLEAFYDLLSPIGLTKEGLIRYHLIETALKRLEQFEVEKQSFDRLIEKKLKALDIIKEKGVDVIWVLETKNVEEYNDSLCIYSELTQEEYDLLKEVLNND